MTKILKCFLSAILIFLVATLLGTSALAETVAKNSDHALSVTLPENYLLLNDDTAEDNLELIESLGYSLSSFKNYLKPTKNGDLQTLFIGVEPSSKSQISVKSWSTDFSKKIGSLAPLDDEALSQTAKELVTTKGASYKSVSANGMKLIEVRFNSKDSGGDFCSVQYLTICNGNFYSLNFTFSGKLDTKKTDLAWNTLSSFKIKTDLDNGAWDTGSIFVIVLLSIAILGAIVLAVIIIISIIKDIQKRRADPIETDDFIERRR